MRYIVHTSDIHLGLTTNEIDRTEEIVSVVTQAINKAVKLKKKGKVDFVFGGDIFNHNNPSEYLIGQFIGLLNLLKKKKIKTFIVVGNHESISDPERKSCLDFIGKIKEGYPNLRLIDDIYCMKYYQSDLGDTYLTFLPHITKAHLKGTKYKSVQKYIDKKCASIKKQLGRGVSNFVFSHLNVKGVIVGSEENLLKKSEAFLPDCFVFDEEDQGFLPPVITNAHIHTRQKIGNVYINGSPIFCTFGEKENNKYFSVIHLPERFDERMKIQYVKTKCKKFLEIEWNEKTKIKNVKKLIDKDTVLKINGIQGPHDSIDWNSIREKLSKKAYYVKPITPKIIRDRIKRNDKQIIKLAPKDAVKIWLKQNKPDQKKAIKSKAFDYIDNLVIEQDTINIKGKQLKVYSLELENFMLYRKFKKRFDDKEVIGLICQYIDNKKKSNRGGKTTIIEAIKYALFGLSRAKKETSLIHYGQDLMKVTLILIDEDGIKYKIVRGRDINNRGILEAGWIEKKREGQKAIDELVGSDKKDFELTTFFKQQDINGFMEKNAVEKKKYMMHWLRNMHWPKLSDTVSEDVRNIAGLLKELRIKKATLKEELGNKKKFKKKIKSLTDSIKKVNGVIKKKKASVEKLQKKNVLSSDDKKGIKKEKESIKDELEEIKLELSSIQKAKVSYKKCKESIAKLEAKKPKCTTEKQVKRFEKKQYGIAAKIDADIKTLRVIEKEFTGMCPILKEKCDRIEYDPSIKKRIKKSIKSNRKKLQDLDKERKIIDRDNDRLFRIIDLKNTAKNLKSKKKGEKVLVERKAAKWGRLRGLGKQLEKGFNTKVDRKIEILNDVISQSSELVSEANRKLGSLEGDLKHYDKSKTKIESLNVKQNNLQKELEILKYIALMFGKNGIPSQEIENAFDEIEDDINHILDKMDCGLEVVFSSDKELDQWEQDCTACGWRFPKGTRLRECESCNESRKKKRKDELSLNVIEDGVEAGFEMESTGGQFLISIATRIALTRLKQRQTGCNFGALFLDEPDKPLDEYNREKLMTLVTTSLIKTFGFNQVFWISHSKNIQESIPHVLQVDRFSKPKKFAKARWL